MNLIIDCNYVCHVVRFSLSTGLTYRGNHTGVIYGFLKQLQILTAKFEPTDIIFCWDSQNSKRREIFPEYKIARRTKRLTDEEKESSEIAYAQFNLIREEILPTLGFRNNFHIDGLEGDDLIASIVQANDNPFIKSIVVTSDNDMLQILSDTCSLYNISQQTLTTNTEFIRTYGFEPKLWAVVKTIAGCNSDEVPGVRGVGEKTAAKYLRNELKPGKILNSIKEFIGSDDYHRNIKLVSLPFFGTPTLEIKPDMNHIGKFSKVFDKYGLQSLSKQEQETGLWTKTFLDRK